MKQLASILKMRLFALKNQARNLRKDSAAKIFAILFGLTNVIGIGFWVSYESFKFIESFPAFGASLNAKMICLLFFSLLVLVILSTILVVYATVFLARETEFFFQYPVSPRIILGVKLSEAIAFSSWATLFLCLPVLVAFGFLRKAPLTYYFEAALILTLFLLFAGLMGTAICLVLAPLVRRLSPRQILAGGGALLAVLGWVFLRSFNIWDMDDTNNLLILDRFTSQLSAMHSPYSPSNWASSAILAAVVGNHREVAFHSCTLLANTLIFVPILAWYGKQLYGFQWIASRGSLAGAARKGDRRWKAPPAGKEAEATPETRRGGIVSMNPLAALISKDLLVFLRDPAQLSQSILFILLMVIYSLSLLRIPEFFTNQDLQLLVYFANLGAVCMILSSFTSRFIFPLISLEGRAFWIVGLAPLSRAYLVFEKAFFGLGISLLLGIITMGVSNMALHSPPHLLWTAMYCVALASVCLTSLATGLGAAYPVFDEDNPARIAVGLGGTLNFFASALSVAIVVGIEALPYLAFGSAPGLWRYAAHLLALIFTAALTGFCFRLGTHSLAGREF